MEATLFFLHFAFLILHSLMLEQSLLYDFELAGRRMRLWKKPGEKYEHVLMKALGYAMFVGEFPELEIERRVGVRYKPDLVARDSQGRFLFWGECGANSVRKTAWLLKHAGVERLVLFKIERGVVQLVKTLRAEVSPRYRPPGRILLINFVEDVVARTLERRIERVPKSWYTETEI
jgi:hypothetical protein